MSDYEQIIRFSTLQKKVAMSSATQDERNEFQALLRMLAPNDGTLVNLAGYFLANKPMDIQTSDPNEIERLKDFAEFLGGTSETIKDETGAIRVLLRPKKIIG